MSSNKPLSSQLLPKSSGHFARKDYWNRFFSSRRESFEWYAECHHLRPLLARYVKSRDSLLVIGCGNSTLSADLYDTGYRDNTSVDISPVVVQQMTDKYCPQRPGLHFNQMDVFDMTFEAKRFNAVIDKGTLDAIASDKQSTDNVYKMFEQIDRVLKPFGRYFCVSLLESHILKMLMTWFTTHGHWLIRVERVEAAEESTRFETTDNSLVLPVFAVICTKLLPPSDGKPAVDTIVELVLNDNEKPKRLESTADVYEPIESIQEFAFIRHFIQNIDITGRQEDEDIYLDLFDEMDSHNPRYTLYFSNYVNKRSKSMSTFGVFIVPEGREIEWLFATAKGRAELTKQSGFERLIVVHLNRNHKFEDMEQIKSQLSPKIMELVPKSVINSDTKIPFLTIGEDVGKRTVVYRGTSDLSGDYVVEEIVINNSQYRRLIFLKNKNIIQSEAKLKTIKKGKKTVLVIDPHYLSCSHHEIITAGLTLLASDQSKQYNVLLVGLGGGCLATYMIDNIRGEMKLNIKVIEIDAAMKDVAIKWFDLKVKSFANKVEVDICVDDGLTYIAQLDPTVHSFDAIIFDVDSKDVNVGLSCPPMPFLDIDFLEKVKSLVCQRNGIFVLNLVSRNEDIKRDVYQRLNRVFDTTYVQRIHQELNEILFAFPAKDSVPEWVHHKGVANKTGVLSKHCFYIPLLKESYIDLCSDRFARLPSDITIH